MNGIIVVNKEKNYTSRDIVNVLNKILNTKKIGHTGTLDPIATGVLVVCVGKYTKLVDLITGYDKEYIASIKLGIKTDTLDITGNILEKNEKISVDNYLVINTLNSFLGFSMQEVPYFSAIKINGKKLYQYARNKEEITLPKRKIFIKEIELLENNKDLITFRCVVSKGTYIRSLIKDITEKLNVIGCMASLKRVKQGNFSIKKSFSLEDIKNNNYKMLKIEDIFDYKTYELNKEEYFKISNGVSINIESLEENYLVKYNKEYIGIMKKEENSYKMVFRCF